MALRLHLASVLYDAGITLSPAWCFRVAVLPAAVCVLLACSIPDPREILRLHGVGKVCSPKSVANDASVFEIEWPLHDCWLWQAGALVSKQESEVSSCQSRQCSVLALTPPHLCHSDCRTYWRRNSTHRCLHSATYSEMLLCREEGARELRKAHSRCCVGSCEQRVASSPDLLQP